MSKFCYRCGVCPDVFAPGDEGCEIMLRSWLEIDDDHYPEEWTFDANGNPTCTAFEVTS